MLVFRRFVHYLVPYRKHVVLTFICTGLFVAFSSTAYWLAASFLQALFSGSLSEPVSASGSLNDFFKGLTYKLLYAPSPSGILFKGAIAIVVAFFGKNLFSYLQLYFISYFEQRVIKDLRDEIFSNLVAQDLGFFHGQKRGHLISNTLNDVEILNIALNKSFSKIIRDPINALFVLVLLFIVSAKLTLFALIIIPIVGWTVLVLASKIKVRSSRAQEAMANITGRLQETIGGIRIVKAFSGELFEENKFGNSTQQYYQNALGRDMLSRMVIPLTEFIGVIIFSGLLYVGGSSVLVSGTMGSEDFIRFLVLLFALLTPILSLGDFTANIRLAEAAGERVFKLLDVKPTLKLSDAPVSINEFDEIISFNDVSFRYQPTDPEVLSGISFKIKRGEHIAIVGRSGSGKSTLVNLLPRFYDPTSGHISMDGKDIKLFDIYKLRCLFGVVTQQVVLFHDTIFSNIAYGQTEVNYDLVQKAGLAALADEFIGKLPDGYETVVGEHGALFSGGQKQRISIARAILRDPSIIILDEATSALDPESSKIVSKALEKLSEGRTVISVTHRISSIKNFDRIIVLKDGKISGEGDHEYLIHNCEEYKALAIKQRKADIIPTPET